MRPGFMGDALHAGPARLLILFFFVNSMFSSQIALFLSARFSWHGHPFGAR